MKLLRFLLLNCSVLLLSIQTQAQQSKPQRWPLQGCIEYVAAHNITLERLRLDQDIATQNPVRTKAAKLPSISSSLSHSIVNSNNADPVLGGFQTQAGFTGNYGLSTWLTLYNGGYLSNDKKRKISTCSPLN